MEPLVVIPAKLPALMSRLTPRQVEIIGLLAQGHSNKQAGTLLSISGETVKRHVYRACHKLGIENRTQLIFVFGMWQAIKEKETEK